MNLLRRLWTLPENMPRVVLGHDFGRARGDARFGAAVMRGRRFDAGLELGPNAWHALVIHPDGSYEDIGVSYNLLTNAGRDLIAAALGNPAHKGGALTASTATSATPAGGGMTTDAYKGWRIFAPVTGLTTSPVYGNVGANSATVITVDQWWDSADAVGTTPSATAGYHMVPCAEARFMGLSAEGTTPVATDTVLATEQTGNGLARALATYAHTGGVATYTLQKSFSVTGSVTVHKGALFTAKDTTAGGVMIFAANLNSDAIVGNGDTLQVTATVTLS